MYKYLYIYMYGKNDVIYLEKLKRESMSISKTETCKIHPSLEANSWTKNWSSLTKICRLLITSRDFKLLLVNTTA